MREECKGEGEREEDPLISTRSSPPLRHRELITKSMN
jgi:hypothetical protein